MILYLFFIYIYSRGKQNQLPLHCPQSAPVQCPCTARADRSHCIHTTWTDQGHCTHTAQGSEGTMSPVSPGSARTLSPHCPWGNEETIRPLKKICVTQHFFKGWNVPPRQHDSRHEIGPKKAVIRDIIWQHNQKPWNLRCFQLLSNKKNMHKSVRNPKISRFWLWFP